MPVFGGTHTLGGDMLAQMPDLTAIPPGYRLAEKRATVEDITHTSPDTAWAEHVHPAWQPRDTRRLTITFVLEADL